MEEIQTYWPVFIITIPLLALFFEILVIRYLVLDHTTAINKLTTLILPVIMLSGLGLVIERHLLQPKYALLLFILVVVVSTISLQLKSTARKK